MNQIFAWHNVLFLVPGAAGVVLAFLSATGVGADSDADADHDHDVDHDHDHDTDHDQDHDQDQEGEHDHGPGLLERAMSLLGVGRTPVMILLTMLLLFFAFSGISANLVLGRYLPPQLFVALSAVLAAVASFVATALLGRVVARVVPKEESYASSFSALVGQAGRVVLTLDKDGGYAQVHDRFGNLQEVRCRSVDGQRLHAGQLVLVAAVEDASRVCLVVVDELNEEVAQ